MRFSHRGRSRGTWWRTQDRSRRCALRLADQSGLRSKLADRHRRERVAKLSQAARSPRQGLSRGRRGVPSGAKPLGRDPRPRMRREAGGTLAGWARSRRKRIRLHASAGRSQRRQASLSAQAENAMPVRDANGLSPHRLRGSTLEPVRTAGFRRQRQADHEGACTDPHPDHRRQQLEPLSVAAVTITA